MPRLPPSPTPIEIHDSVKHNYFKLRESFTRSERLIGIAVDFLCLRNAAIHTCCMNGIYFVKCYLFSSLFSETDKK